MYFDASTEKFGLSASDETNMLLAYLFSVSSLLVLTSFSLDWNLEKESESKNSYRERYVFFYQYGVMIFVTWKHIQKELRLLSD